MIAKEQRLLLVDDDHLFVLLMSDFLQEEGYEVVTAYDGEEGLVSAQQHCPDLIVTDIMMPRCNGFELVERLRQVEQLSSVPIIFLSAKGETSDRIQGLRLGADAYLVKPFEFEELTALIEAHLRPGKNSAPAPQSAVPPILKEHLTTTERSVLTFVAMGMLNKEIAKKMCISTRTVESHVRNLLQKTALANRTALARWAMDMQLV